MFVVKSQDDGPLTSTVGTETLSTTTTLLSTSTLLSSNPDRVSSTLAGTSLSAATIESQSPSTSTLTSAAALSISSSSVIPIISLGSTSFVTVYQPATVTALTGSIPTATVWIPRPSFSGPLFPPFPRPPLEAANARSLFQMREGLLIFGCIAGGLALLISIGVLSFCLCRRSGRKRRRTSKRDTIGKQSSRTISTANTSTVDRKDSAAESVVTPSVPAITRISPTPPPITTIEAQPKQPPPRPPPPPPIASRGNTSQTTSALRPPPFATLPITPHPARNQLSQIPPHSISHPIPISDSASPSSNTLGRHAPPPSPAPSYNAPHPPDVMRQPRLPLTIVSPLDHAHPRPGFGDNSNRDPVLAHPYSPSAYSLAHTSILNSPSRTAIANKQVESAYPTSSAAQPYFELPTSVPSDIPTQYRASTHDYTSRRGVDARMSSGLWTDLSFLNYSHSKSTTATSNSNPNSNSNSNHDREQNWNDNPVPIQEQQSYWPSTRTNNPISHQKKIANANGSLSWIREATSSRKERQERQQEKPRRSFISRASSAALLSMSRPRQPKFMEGGYV